MIPRDVPRGACARDRPRLVGEALRRRAYLREEPHSHPPPPPGRRPPPLRRLVAPRGTQSAAASTCGSEVGRKLASLDALNWRGARAHRRGLGREARSRPRAACGRPVGWDEPCMPQTGCARSVPPVREAGSRAIERRLRSASCLRTGFFGAGMQNLTPKLTKPSEQADEAP